MTVLLKADKNDVPYIEQTAERARDIAERHGNNIPMIDFMMDVTATHLNGCPLNLAALAKARDSDFAHDIFGIRRHLDRETGKLQNCFIPRYAA